MPGLFFVASTGDYGVPFRNNGVGVLNGLCFPTLLFWERSMSELLQRLLHELSLLTDPAARAQLIAKIAAVHARFGRFDEARFAISAIKEQFGKGESGRVTVWKMIAEGLVFHYEDLSPAALERIGGALVLGRAMQYPTVIALASAWKAHIEFERSDFGSMAKSLGIALQFVGPADHDAHTRISMVLANAFMICGDRLQMQAWFMRGREHAVKNRDRASVEALQYNKAAFATAWARVSACDAPIDAQELGLLRGEVNSARNLQELAGIGALPGHIHLIDARLLMLEGRYDLAVDALNQVRNTEPFAGHNFHQSYIDLELEFCAVRLGGADFSIVHRYTDILQQLSRLDIDERIVACWMLAEIAAKAELPDEHAHLKRVLGELLCQHELERRALRTSLESLAYGLHDNPAVSDMPSMPQ